MVAVEATKRRPACCRAIKGPETEPVGAVHSIQATRPQSTPARGWTPGLRGLRACAAPDVPLPDFACKTTHAPALSTLISRRPHARIDVPFIDLQISVQEQGVSAQV